MDAKRFDRLARTLSAGTSRRCLFHLFAALPLVGSLAVLLGVEESPAQRRRTGRGQVNQDNHKHKGRRRGHKNHQRKRRHQHVCKPESVAQTCADTCGPVKNNCQKTVDCGPCDCGLACPVCQVCNASNGQCEADAALDGETCGACRTCADGICSSPCNGEGCCDAGACAPGTDDDACGIGGEDCRACGVSTPVCGAPSPGVCGAICVPRTCAAFPGKCGPFADGCGGLTPPCGACTLPETCGGGGTPSVCGTGTCTPRTCAAQGIQCGLAGDGCGGTINCGVCPTGQTCGGGGVPSHCGTPAA